MWGDSHNNYQGGGDVTYSPDPVLLGSASLFDGHCVYRILVDSQVDISILEGPGYGGQQLIRSAG